MTNAVSHSATHRLVASAIRGFPRSIEPLDLPKQGADVRLGR
jgi:hypothetical protein